MSHENVSLKLLLHHANLCILILSFLFLSSLFNFSEDYMTKTDKQYIKCSEHKSYVKSSFQLLAMSIYQ